MFWFIFQFNQFCGNLTAALLFQFNVPNRTIFIILTAVGLLGAIGFLFLKPFSKEIRYFDSDQIQHFAATLNEQHTQSIQRRSTHESGPSEPVPSAQMGYDQLSWDKSMKSAPNQLQQQLMQNQLRFEGDGIDRDRNQRDQDTHSSVLLFHEYHRTQRREQKVDCILTIKMWFSWNFLMIWPLSVYSGVTQGFQFGEFGARIDSDAFTFYALAAFGLFDAVFSSIFGKLSDRLGRLPILCCAITAHAAVYVFLYFYADSISQKVDGLWIWLCCGALLGIGDAGFNTQILSLYPILLGDRPESFANFNLWQSASSCWCFFWHDFVSFEVKCATYLGVLLIAAMPLFLTSTGRQAARSKKIVSGSH